MDRTGQSGLITIPALTPWEWISPMTSSLFSRAASKWKLIMAAPAFAKRSTYFSGFTIIRWTSRGFRAFFAIASTTGKPKEMFGTKVPSIMSRWKMSAYLFTTSTSFSRLRKSAASIDGAMSIFVISI